MAPLASEEEWETDPELKAMRREFVASFDGRRAAIEAALPALRAGAAGMGAVDSVGGGAFVDALRGVAQIAHKLSGAAETYGFPTLTRACAAYEDWFDRRESGHDPRAAAEGAELMIALLKRCAELGKDASELGSDPRFGALRG
jgi:HPt (histidine-containing phosphotransfer) domain-containing protein